MSEQYFGIELSSVDVLSEWQSLDGWEARYRQLMLWGKKIAPLPLDMKTDNARVTGCETNVWLHAKVSDGVWLFDVDADARIVKGMIAVVLAAYNHQRGEDILTFDIDHYFAELGLLKHLSPSRGNGLKAIVDKIKAIVAHSPLN